MNDVENHMVINGLWYEGKPDTDFPKCDYCGEIITDAKFLDLETLTLHRYCLIEALKDRRKRFGFLRQYAAEYILEDDYNIKTIGEWSRE